jgi:hypothetical protein
MTREYPIADPDWYLACLRHRIGCEIDFRPDFLRGQVVILGNIRDIGGHVLRCLHEFDPSFPDLTLIAYEHLSEPKVERADAQNIYGLNFAGRQQFSSPVKNLSFP